MESYGCTSIITLPRGWLLLKLVPSHDCWLIDASSRETSILPLQKHLRKPVGLTLILNIGLEASVKLGSEVHRVTQSSEQLYTLLSDALYWSVPHYVLL